MRLTPIATPRPLSAAADAQAGSTMAGLIDATGEAEFAGRALDLLDQLTPVASWSTYTLHEGQPPDHVLGATRGARDITSDCWRVYRTAGLYRQDRSFDDARSLLRSHTLVLSHLRASELPEAHRAAIYERHALQERISLIVPEGERGILAVNLYRFAGEPGFGPADTQRIAGIAPVLVATVRKHRVLTAPARQARPPADPVPLLRARFPRLTERELDVCAGLLQGWTFDGIAAHLGLAPATVKTYRDRAFRTLGISHRHQLFSLCHAAPTAH